MHSTKSIYTFVAIMTVVVALILAGMYTGLKDIHSKNEAIYNKRAVISAVEGQLDKPLAEMTDDDVQAVFDSSVEQVGIDANGNPIDQARIVAAGYPGGKAEDIELEKEFKKPAEDRIYPLFVYKKGNNNYYITTVRGKGLWDAIWGFIALESDFKTVSGVAFDHKGETPGLGAEIKDNQGFKDQFIGKKIADDKGDYMSIAVIKGSGATSPFEVDGISGATITCDGVSDMLYSGLKIYEPYFASLDK